MPKLMEMKMRTKAKLQMRQPQMKPPQTKPKKRRPLITKMITMMTATMKRIAQRPRKPKPANKSSHKILIMNNIAVASFEYLNPNSFTIINRKLREIK